MSSRSGGGGEEMAEDWADGLWWEKGASGHDARKLVGESCVAGGWRGCAVGPRLRWAAGEAGVKAGTGIM